jgi:hypothetical protein
MGGAAPVAFAWRGADVAFSYLPDEEPDAREVIALIEAGGRIGLAIPSDLRSEEFCQRLEAEAVRDFGAATSLSPTPGASRAALPSSIFRRKNSIG